MITQFAELFGCVIGLKTPITAIIFVAVGTSLPELFASYKAARYGKNADVAIGNILGSNSVNVYLGLGISWIIGIIHYESRDETYRYPSKTIPFSVMLYLILSGTGLIFLFLRRLITGGELGGSGFWRWTSFSFFMLLWCIYILFSTLKAYEEV